MTNTNLPPDVRFDAFLSYSQRDIGVVRRIQSFLEDYPIDRLLGKWKKLRMRALKALAEEARMMLDEGVVSTAAEIDICMLLGAGWPMMLGGILPYLDREGISEAVSGQRFHPAGVASLA